MRRGNTTVTPGIQLPAGTLTRAHLQQLGEPVVQVDPGGVGDEEIADISFSKLLSGTLLGVAADNVYNDGVANGTLTFISATAAFVDADIEKTIRGPTIPDRTAIESRIDSTTVVLSNPIAAGTALAFTLEDRDPGPGTKILTMDGASVYMRSSNYRSATGSTPGEGWALGGNGQFRFYTGVFAGRIEPLIMSMIWRTGGYTVGRRDFHILCNSNSGAFNVVIPSATVERGRIIIITKNDASANAVTIVRSGADTIEGATTLVLAAQYDKAMLQADGLNTWLKI